MNEHSHTEHPMIDTYVRPQILEAMARERTPSGLDFVGACAVAEQLILAEQWKVAEAVARWCAGKPHDADTMVRECLAALFPSA